MQYEDQEKIEKIRLNLFNKWSEVLAKIKNGCNDFKTEYEELVCNRTAYGDMAGELINIDCLDRLSKGQNIDREELADRITNYLDSLRRVLRDKR